MTATIHCGSPTRSKLRSPITAAAAIIACARRSTFLRANYASSVNACAAQARRRPQSSHPAAITEMATWEEIEKYLKQLKRDADRRVIDTTVAAFLGPFPGSPIAHANQNQQVNENTGLSAVPQDYGSQLRTGRRLSTARPRPIRGR